jgi:flagellar motor protein MotB
MANGLFCAFFPYLLGLTLILFLLWALFHLARAKEDRSSPSPPSVGILWLTPACAEALGRCSQPGRLRSMSARGISARLDRYDFPADERRPTREEYSTWPEQADLICKGLFGKLASYQNELITKPGVEGDRSERANLKASRGAWTVLDALLVLAFICAVLTLLSWILTDFLRACAPPVDCKTSCSQCPVRDSCRGTPKPTVLTLSADQEFEYDDARISDPENLKELLTERLTQFEKVNLTITGFTDPIGGACYNRRLGNDRADAIIEIVRQISPAAQINRLEPVVREEQMSESDKALADKCKAKFHFGKPELEQPLRFFTVDERKKKVNGCMREPNDLTPNFIWGRCVPGENTEAQEDQCLIHYDPKCLSENKLNPVNHL